jgi:uncharacterized membrane protein YjjB (DUF3815 family)
MLFVEQLITSFIATGAFGIIFNAPKQSLIKCGLVGAVGWLIYIVMEYNHFDAIVATLVASFFIAVMSQAMSKIYKTPIIIFSVSGVIPLVPGGLAYDAMKYFVLNDYTSAVTLAAKVFMISGAIAIGLIFSEVINQVIRQSKLHMKS